MSLPQQPHGGGAKPPDPNAWVDKFMKKNLPKPPLGAEDMIRQDKQMRSANESRGRFPEVFGPNPHAPPTRDEESRAMLEAQKYIWEYPGMQNRDIQTSYNSGLPPWNVSQDPYRSPLER